MSSFEVYKRCKESEYKSQSTSDTLKYSQDEICPVCGRYSADGSVCIICQKDYGIYKPRATYTEF